MKWLLLIAVGLVLLFVGLRLYHAFIVNPPRCAAGRRPMMSGMLARRPAPWPVGQALDH